MIENKKEEYQRRSSVIIYDLRFYQIYICNSEKNKRELKFAMRLIQENII